jgi:hypothetical protein
MASNVRIAGSTNVTQSGTATTVATNVDRRKAIINAGGNAGTVAFDGSDTIAIASGGTFTIDDYQGPITVTGSSCKVLEFE